MAREKKTSKVIRGTLITWWAVEGGIEKGFEIMIRDSAGRSQACTVNLIPITCLRLMHMDKPVVFSVETETSLTKAGEPVSRRVETLTIQVSEKQTTVFQQKNKT